MSFIDQDFESKELTKLQGHTDRVWSLAWNFTTGINGVPAMLASCSGDKTAILDETHTRTVRSCAWSPSGKHLATTSFDATTAIWEHVGDDFECVATLEVKCVSWNPSGLLLATCSRDKSVWIWEVLPGNEFECVVVLRGHTQDVKMVQWHPDMDILFSCSYDNTIKNAHCSTIFLICSLKKICAEVTGCCILSPKIWKAQNRGKDYVKMHQMLITASTNTQDKIVLTIVTTACRATKVIVSAHDTVLGHFSSRSFLTESMKSYPLKLKF
ncbi:hypothetical protein ACHQM5_004404 [Ranunculus cassubicifolius]